MRKIRSLAVGVAAATLALGGVLAAPAGAASQAAFHSRHVCGAPAQGAAGCDAIVRTNSKGKPLVTAAPSGYGPADLRSAYNLGTANSTKTVAIVDAYNDPTAESDLAVYRSQYGLPACTAAGGCFKKVNQSGGTSYPRTNGGWAQEISLDVDMVSAICPGCHILLVEASSASFSNLAAAVSYAATQTDVVAISNSYGGSDSSGITAYETAAASGIAVTASTGDNGYGVQSPASFQHVVAVGGTHLTRDSSARGWTESAWSGAGSGCSTINAQPSYQSRTITQCGKKVNADVSAVADPHTGVAVYDSTSYQGASGWMVFGGTSVSSPIIASVYALAGNTGSTVHTYAGSYPWGANAGALNDATGGSNGSCSPSLWCTGVAGWDGPTGLGTPSGTGAF